MRNAAEDAWRARLQELAGETNRAYLVALRVSGSPALAEEAVQEAFARILSGPLLADLGPHALRAYLLKTVRGTAINALESARASRQREEGKAMATKFEPAAPDEHSARAEEARAARAALAELPQDERETVSLCCEQDLPQQEAAEILGVHPKTIAYRLKSGLEKLRLRLSAQGYASATPLALALILREHGLPQAPALLTDAVVRAMSSKTLGGSVRVVAKATAAGGAAALTGWWIAAGALALAAAGTGWALWGAGNGIKAGGESPDAAVPEVSTKTESPNAGQPPAEKLLGCWIFEGTGAEEITLLSGVFAPVAPGEKPGVLAEDARFLLPIKLGSRPVRVTIYPRAAQEEGFRQMGIYRVSGETALAGRSWRRKWGAKMPAVRRLDAYFIGSSVVVLYNGEALGLLHYPKAEDGQTVVVDANQWVLERIEAHELDSESLPEMLRDLDAIKDEMGPATPFHEEVLPMKPEF